MQLIRPSADIINDAEPFGVDLQCWGVHLLRKIEFAARISHRSEDAQTPDSWKRFIQSVVIEHGDWSVVEHSSLSVDFTVDRGLTHEIVRHRLFSFTQESTRFVNYDKVKSIGEAMVYKNPATFVRPETFTKPIPGSINPAGPTEDVCDNIWENAINTAEEYYRKLVQQGCPPQLARDVLPNALSARLIMTGNLRNWRHFLIMRTSKQTHPKLLQVTVPLLAKFKAVIPILYDDIEAGMSQSEAIKKAR